MPVHAGPACLRRGEGWAGAIVLLVGTSPLHPNTGHGEVPGAWEPSVFGLCARLRERPGMVGTGTLEFLVLLGSPGIPGWFQTRTTVLLLPVVNCTHTGKSSV